MSNIMANAITEEQTWFITTFYKFVKISDLHQTQAFLEKIAQDNHIRGLVVLGNEGFNSTCCADSEENLNQFKKSITEHFNCPELLFKDSQAHFAPFRKFKVKQRPEIVTTGNHELQFTQEKNHHLSPAEWNAVLKNEKDWVMYDTRNWYETDIGTFKGTTVPNIEQFTEFFDWVDHQNQPKDKKMLIFCTGGIRCDKGILEMQRRGYTNVYQLEGGILNYLKEYPNDQFEGECFVFDHRVSVQQDLSPSTKYKMCPHCGQPAETKINCSRCDSEAHICKNCLKLDFDKETCSKHCSHQLKLHPGKKGKPQLRDFVTGITPGL